MRLNVTLARTFVALVAFAMSLTLTADDDYVIRLHRASKIGDKIKFSFTGHLLNSMVLSSGKKVLKQQLTEFDATCTGTYTVIAVDEKGRPTNYKIKIKSLTQELKDSGKKEALLEPGSEITIKATKKGEEYLKDGKPLSPNLLSVVKIFFTLPHSNCTDDDIFGTKKRVKIGDSWGINVKAIAEDAKKDGINVSPNDIKGSTILEKVVEANGLKCLHISSGMKTSKFSVPLPPGFTLAKSSLDAKFQGDFPVDLSKEPPFSSTSVTIIIGAVGVSRENPNAPPVTLLIKNARSASGTFAPVEEKNP